MAFSALLFSTAVSIAWLIASVEPSAIPLPVGPDSVGVREVADFATVYYNLRSKDKYVYKVTAILDVQAKVDQGILYTMDVDLGKTECLNGKTPALESCPLFHSPGETKTLRCHFVVLCNPLQEQKQLLDSSCQPVQD